MNGRPRRDAPQAVLRSVRWRARNAVRVRAASRACTIGPSHDDPRDALWHVRSLTALHASLRLLGESLEQQQPWFAPLAASGRLSRSCRDAVPLFGGARQRPTQPRRSAAVERSSARARAAAAPRGRAVPAWARAVNQGKSSLGEVGDHGGRQRDPKRHARLSYLFRAPTCVRRLPCVCEGLQGARAPPMAAHEAAAARAPRERHVLFGTPLTWPSGELRPRTEQVRREKRGSLLSERRRGLRGDLGS